MNHNYIFSKYRTVLLSLISLLTLGILSGIIGCQSGMREQEPGDTTVEQQPSAEDLLRGKYEQALRTISNHDSLTSAYQYLQELKSYGVEQSWIHAETMRINFLVATYTDTPQDSGKQLYNQGQQAAFTLIQQQPLVAEYLQSGDVSLDSVTDSVSMINPEPIYYWAINDLFWLRTEQPITRLVSRRRIERAINLLQQTHPDYRWAAVERLRGLLLTISPDGDLNNARESFEKAINEGREFLENHFFYGRYYGVLLQDKDLFMKQMDEILLAESTAPEEINDLNTLIKKRAEQLKQQPEEYFIIMR